MTRRAYTLSLILSIVIFLSIIFIFLKLFQNPYVALPVSLFLGVVFGLEIIRLINRRSTLYNIYLWIKTKIKTKQKFKNIDYTKIDPFNEEDWNEVDYETYEKKLFGDVRRERRVTRNHGRYSREWNSLLE